MDFVTEQGGSFALGLRGVFGCTQLFLHDFLYELKLGCMELVKVWELDFYLAVTDCVEQNKIPVLMS